MITRETISYCLLNETLVDEDTALENREILRENVTLSPSGARLCTLTFKQVLQSFATRNWNGRVYDQNTVVKAIETNPLIQHDLKMHTWTGEYGHPQIEKGQNELARQMTIFPPNACWTIDRYWVEGNLLMGECTTLAGGYGDMMRDRILTGYPAMASSRAIGGMDDRGRVLPGYMLVTFDGVIRPSHKEAYAAMDTVKENLFNVPAGNTMSESAVPISYNSESFKNFLLSESASHEKIARVCDALDIDYDSMELTETAIRIVKVDGNQRTTVLLPLNKIIQAEYHNLF